MASDQPKPLVTVVIPVYNVEEFLDQCVQSILHQTYEHLEIILVDDGSTDSGGSMCDDYAKCDGRVKVIHQQNGGLSAARNSGIEIAQGEYITFVDSDDWVSYDYVGHLLEAAIKTQCPMSVCGRTWIFGDEDPATAASSSPAEGVLTDVEVLDIMMRTPTPICEASWAKIYKLDLFDEVRFPVGKVHEDIFTTYKLVLAAGRVACVNESLLYYRQRPNSISRCVFTPKRLDCIEAALIRYNYFKENGYETLLPAASFYAFDNYALIITRTKKSVWKDWPRMAEYRVGLRGMYDDVKSSCIWRHHLLFKAEWLYVLLARAKESVTNR